MWRMSNHLTPLDVCLSCFGGREAVEKIAGSCPKGSYAWAKPSMTRRAGDLPAHVQRKMLNAARRRGVALDPAWLIEGTVRSKMDAAIGQMKVAAE